LSNSNFRHRATLVASLMLAGGPVAVAMAADGQGQPAQGTAPAAAPEIYAQSQGYQYPVDQGYQYPAEQDYQYPAEQDYQYPAQQAYQYPVDQGYQYAAPQAYDYAAPGYGSQGYDYAAPGYGYGTQTYDYAAQPYDYGSQGYGYAAPQGYAQPQYTDPGYAQQPQYVDPNAAYQAPMGYGGYPMMPPYAAYPGSSQDFPMLPGGWRNNEIFGGDNPFSNPADNEGYWADPRFQPWRSGPFERGNWDDVHPMSNMPWGNFPGWSDGFFGGFGPEQWKGVTPWGNDVPFKWVNPTDPRESIGDMWDDALNTPNAMGRMPPGWTAPYISVPNPVEVEEEFERNARKFPDEMRNMWSTGESDWGGTAAPGESGDGNKGEDGKPQGERKGPRPFIEPIKPVEPVYGDRK